MSTDATGVALELARARTLCELHRHDEARSVVRELLAREPDNGAAWRLLAQAELGAGDAKAALDAADRATGVEPEHEWGHRLRSIALHQLGDKKGAIEAAREAVRTGPNTWQAHSRLAIALSFARRDLKEAVAAAERGVALAPNEPDSHYALGLVSDARRKHKEAEQHFRRALALDPQHSQSHNALARHQLVRSRFGRAGNLADAAAGFRNVVQTDPSADYAVRNLEFVLRVFLSRLSYLIWVIVFIATTASGGTVGDRIGPLLLLAIPAAFAFRFLFRLEPDLRRHLRHVVFRGKLAAPSIAQGCALGLLLVSAAAPTPARPALDGGAVVAALIARILLARGASQSLLSIGRRRLIVAAVGLTILFFIGTTLGGGFNPARGAFFVILALAAAALYNAVRRRRA